jgi:hypothetical protein
MDRLAEIAGRDGTAGGGEKKTRKKAKSKVATK